MYKTIFACVTCLMIGSTVYTAQKALLPQATQGAANPHVQTAKIAGSKPFVRAVAAVSSVFGRQHDEKKAHLKSPSSK